MAFAWFSKQRPLDEESVVWIFDVFAWALRHLDAKTFVRETLLVLPANAYFPGHASSAEEMAELIFERTCRYAGMRHWPLRLVKSGSAETDQHLRVSVPRVLRGGAGPQRADGDAASQTSIPIAYEPNLIKHPEAMIAGFAQVLAYHLGSAVAESPPGGRENWPQTIEVLGAFLGFGVLFANTAFEFRTHACGNCGGPPARRQVFLSQYDVTYALAVFCVLKERADRQVLPHLKPSLRAHFKRCRKDVLRRQDALAALRAMAESGVSDGTASP